MAATRVLSVRVPDGFIEWLDAQVKEIQREREPGSKEVSRTEALMILALRGEKKKAS